MYKYYNSNSYNNAGKNQNISLNFTLKYQFLKEKKSYPVCACGIESDLPLVPRLALIEVPAPYWLSTKSSATIGLIDIERSNILTIHLIVKCQTNGGSRILWSVLGTDKVGGVVGSHRG